MSAKHKHRAMDRPVTRRYLDRQLTRLYTDLTRTIIHASEPGHGITPEAIVRRAVKLADVEAADG